MLESEVLVIHSPSVLSFIYPLIISVLLTHSLLTTTLFPAPARCFRENKKRCFPFRSDTVEKASLTLGPSLKMSLLHLPALPSFMAVLDPGITGPSFEWLPVRGRFLFGSVHDLDFSGPRITLDLGTLSNPWTHPCPFHGHWSTCSLSPIQISFPETPEADGVVGKGDRGKDW